MLCTFVQQAVNIGTADSPLFPDLRCSKLAGPRHSVDLIGVELQVLGRLGYRQYLLVHWTSPFLDETILMVYTQCSILLRLLAQ